MAKISIDEGRRIAEAQAWAERGKKYGFWHTYGKRAAPWVAMLGLVLVAAGGVVWVARRIAEAVGSIGAPDLPTGGGGGVPGLAWIALAVLAGLSALFFTGVARSDRFSVMLLQGAGLLGGWVWLLFFIGSHAG